MNPPKEKAGNRQGKLWLTSRSPSTVSIGVLTLQAVDELNIKPKNWKDLLTEEPFHRKDIIHIQDPLKIEGRQGV